MIDLQMIVLLDTIHRRGTFAAAAEELDRVPSALSYTIQKYEDELGFALFRRQGRRVRFTEAGQHLYQRGLPLLQQAAALADEAETIARGREPRIRVAVESWLSLSALAAPISALLDQYPDLEVQVFEEALSGTWEALLEGRVDIAVGAPAPKPGVGGIQADHLCSVDAVFAVAPGHPLANERRVLDAEALASERWIILRDTARAWVPREVLGFKPTRQLGVGSMADKLAAQVAGLGVGFLPRHLASPYVARGELVELPVTGLRSPMELLLAWRTDSRGQGLQSLLTGIREWITSS